MDLCKYVNVFHGADSRSIASGDPLADSWNAIKPLNGNTTPAATLPFGKYTSCPFSRGYTSGYGMYLPNSTSRPTEKSDDRLLIEGFSHFCNSGTGAIGTYYNYAVITPYYGTREKNYTAKGETATPGYYAVTLADTDIKCELTVSEYAAYHRYTFEKQGGKINFDFENDGLFGYYSGKAEDIHVEAKENELNANAVFSGVRLYFTAKIEADGAFDGNNVFQMDGAGTVVIKVSVSAVSEAESKKENALAQAPFDTAAADALEKWEKALSKIEINGDDNEKEIFYSNLYHTFVKPCDWGKGSFLRDDAPFVVDFSTMWDIYKTQLPLLYSLFGELSRDIVGTFLNIKKTYGRFLNGFMLSSRTEICAEQARMLMPVSIYDALQRGDYADFSEAYGYILDEAEINEDFRIFAETGKGKTASHTLDMAVASYAISLMAQKLGRDGDAEKYRALSENYKNAFDTETGLLISDSVYYEGNLFSYSFRPMFCSKERIAICGEKKFTELLDRFFGFNFPDEKEDRFQGFNNETDMEAPYAYHAIGRYDRIAAITKAADKYMFRDKNGRAGRGAIPGNNDSGGLSSCYVWNTLGLFPQNGTPYMLVSTPKFNEAEMHLANGNELKIIKTGNGDFAKAAFLNGKPLEDMVLPVRDMMNGGVLEVRV